MADKTAVANPRQARARRASKKARLTQGPLRPGRRPAGPPASGNRPQLNGQTATFIWAYWGDNNLTTMGQETMRLKKAMDGYNYKVLMKHNHTPPWLDLSEGDERRADVMMPPTPANFTAQLVALAQAGYIIDIYINAHGLPGRFTASGGTHGVNDTRITEDIIRALPAAAGLTKLPIRMVYQTHCYAESLNAAWRAAGAKVVTGARTVQFYPYQFGRFMSRWHGGDSVRTANQEGTTAATRSIGQGYILADALAKRTAGEWGGCSFGRTVLGSHACAREYFDYRWFDPGDWQSGMSGKQNMNRASTMVTSGSSAVRKNSLNLTW